MTNDKEVAPVMVDKIPDELVKEILSLVLGVPDDLFFTTSFPSPFCYYMQSTSVILLVCKRWLRVATPLLYQVVVLRTKGQARALDVTLRANKAFGRYIKKLRVEGGFGSAMGAVVRAAPNISDLFLPTAIRSSDNVDELCYALSSINPTRVTLYEITNRLNNTSGRLLRETLSECIKGWSNMKIFEMPRFTLFNFESIAEALSEAPNLETVHTADDCYTPHTPHLDTISLNPALKTIFVKVPLQDVSRSLTDRVNTDARLRALVTFQDPPRVKLLPISSDSSFSPMCHVPNLIKDYIWGRVLAFAMRIDYRDEEQTNPSAEMGINATRRAVSLVSKLFNRLAIPYLYGFPVFTRQAALQIFAARLVENLALGFHLRVLCFHHFHPGGCVEAPVINLRRIISRAPALHELIGRVSSERNDASHRSTLDWDMFLEVANTVGSSLVVFRALRITPPEKPQPPLVFCQFTKIRSLEWDSTIQFDINPALISSDCLSALEHIRVKDYTPSFLIALSCMDLPSLRSVELPLFAQPDVAPFLQKHGAKILKLGMAHHVNLPIFELCPKMSYLTLFISSAPNPALFACGLRQYSLVKITVIPRCDVRAFAKDWLGFFNFSNFPALREIQVYFLAWPHTEPRNPWHAWAEELEKRWNIRLIDGAGRRWRRRLK